MPLPADRQSVDGTDTPALSPVTYGDYFTAICDYLSRPQMRVPMAAAAQAIGESPHADNLTSIRIHLVKHGAFYHPALVTVAFERCRIPLVVNVAVSEQGRAQLPIEVDGLDKLGRAFPENKWVPRVYHSGTGIAAGHRPFPMFTGQWFSGFHEVHRSGGETTPQKWSVWDADRGRWDFSSAQVDDFYRQAFLILTSYFDPHTLSAILDWHHAAGDFVVRRGGAGLEVRLITVRRYAPLFRRGVDEMVDLELLLHALAVFWMRTSLWMRIDRLDGVRELVWAGDRTLSPMWDGFMQGIVRMTRQHDFPDAFAEGVPRYLARYAGRDWLDIGADIVARYPADLSEALLMRQHLDRHAACITSVVQDKAKVRNSAF